MQYPHAAVVVFRCLQEWFLLSAPHDVPLPFFVKPAPLQPLRECCSNVPCLGHFSLVVVPFWTVATYIDSCRLLQYSDDSTAPVCVSVACQTSCYILQCCSSYTCLGNSTHAVSAVLRDCDAVLLRQHAPFVASPGWANPWHTCLKPLVCLIYFPDIPAGRCVLVCGCRASSQWAADSPCTSASPLLSVSWCDTLFLRCCLQR